MASRTLQKNCKKSKKVAIKVNLAHDSFFGRLLIWVLEGFGKGFGGILNRLLLDSSSI